VMVAGPASIGMASVRLPLASMVARGLKVLTEGDTRSNTEISRRQFGSSDGTAGGLEAPREVTDRRGAGAECGSTMAAKSPVSVRLVWKPARDGWDLRAAGGEARVEAIT